MRRSVIVAFAVLRSGWVLPDRRGATIRLALPDRPANPSVEPNTPGNAANSPGSPFNEPNINSPLGGVGGQHYSPNSQYGVACFQQSVHNP